MSGRADRDLATSAIVCAMTTASDTLVVSVVVDDGLVGGFGLGVVAEFFGYDRRAMGLPRFDFALVAPVPGVVRTDTGIPVLV